MTFAIWKFIVPITGAWEAVAIPDGFEVLHVGMQAGKVCFWAKVDPGNTHSLWRFKIVGTGHLIGGADYYVGTAVDEAQGFVWHLFKEACKCRA